MENISSSTLDLGMNSKLQEPKYKLQNKSVLGSEMSRIWARQIIEFSVSSKVK